MRRCITPGGGDSYAPDRKLSHANRLLHFRQMNAKRCTSSATLGDNHFKRRWYDQRCNPRRRNDQSWLEILEAAHTIHTGRDSVYLPRPNGRYRRGSGNANERSFTTLSLSDDQAFGTRKTVGVNTNGSVIGTGAFLLMMAPRSNAGTVSWDVSGQTLENYGVPCGRVDRQRPCGFAQGTCATSRKRGVCRKI